MGRMNQIKIQRKGKFEHSIVPYIDAPGNHQERSSDDESKTIRFGYEIGKEDIRVFGECERVYSPYSQEAAMRTRPRNNRVCDFGRRSRGHRDHSDNGLPSEASRALGCDRRWNIEFVRDQENQRSCEYEHCASGSLILEDNRHRASSSKMTRISDLIIPFLVKLRSRQGQSTVEYAIVFIAFLGIVVGLGLLMNSVEDGLFVEHALSAASHNASIVPGGAADVFSY